MLKHLVVLAFFVTAFSVTSYADDKLPLKVECSGKHVGEFSGAEYPFDLSGEAKVSGAVLAKAGKDALKAIFGSLKDNENKDIDDKGEPVTDVSGKFDVADDGAISGNVKIKWKVKGNNMSISAKLEGTATVKDGAVTSLTLKGTDVKVAGEWEWGGEEPAKLTGEGTLAVSSEKGGNGDKHDDHKEHKK